MKQYRQARRGFLKLVGLGAASLALAGTNAAFAMVCLAAMVLSTGCRRSGVCTVTQYSSEYMTYTGFSDQFNGACRSVLHELSDKEQLGPNKFRYPYYGEGASTHKEGDRLLAVKVHLKTRGTDGAEYQITTLKLGKRDSVVMLESTGSDRHRLINALNVEFHKRGIRVRQY